MAHTLSNVMLLFKLFVQFKSIALHFTLDESSPRFCNASIKIEVHFHTLSYVLKYNIHALPATRPLLVAEKLGCSNPKPNKLYATILIIPQINMYCNSQFTKYKVILFRNPTSEHTVIQSYSLLPIKLTKCTKSLSLFTQTFT